MLILSHNFSSFTNVLQPFEVHNVTIVLMATAPSLQCIAAAMSARPPFSGSLAAVVVLFLSKAALLQAPVRLPQPHLLPPSRDC